MHTFSLEHGASSLILHGPCAALSHGLTFHYRGVAMPCPRHGPLPACDAQGRATLELPHVVSELLLDGCHRPKPIRDWRLGLLELARTAIPAASRAPTPGCNLDDHFQQLNGILASAAAVPEAAAHSLEVGSFAGHTFLLLAASLAAVGLNASFAHAVEPSTQYGIRRAYVHARFNPDGLSRVRWHQRTIAQLIGDERKQAPSRDPALLHRPLRYFFEDSKHDYGTTNASFALFEHLVAEGGIVVMHDVGCCEHQYPGLMRFGRERIFRSPDYREVEAPQTSWEDLGEADRALFHAALRASVDARPFFRNLTLAHELDPKPCSVICAESDDRRAMELGYHWSTCRNTRVFQ